MNSRNYLKTTLLLATMSAIVLLIGSRFAGGAYLPLALAFAVLMNGIAYFFSDKIAILSARAKPVTQGILPILTSRELEGVLAHELSHVKNRDILISSVAATMGAIIMFLARLAWFIPLG